MMDYNLRQNICRQMRILQKKSVFLDSHKVLNFKGKSKRGLETNLVEEPGY